MKWLVNNKDEFDARQRHIRKLIDEKHEQVEKLQFELSLLHYVLNTLRNIGWK